MNPNGDDRDGLHSDGDLVNAPHSFWTLSQPTKYLGAVQAVRREDAVLLVLGHAAQPPLCAVWRRIRCMDLREDEWEGLDSDGDIVNAPQLLWVTSLITHSLSEPDHVLAV